MNDMAMPFECIVFASLHTSTQRCQAWRKKKPKSVYEESPKLQHQNREAVWTVLYPTEEIEIRRKENQYTMQMNDRKTFLGSSLTDNAIIGHVMRLLQLDLELSVQCPMRVHERRSTIEIKHM